MSDDFMNRRCGPVRCHYCGHQPRSWDAQREHRQWCRKDPKSQFNDPESAFNKTLQKMRDEQVKKETEE